MNQPTFNAGPEFVDQNRQGFGDPVNVQSNPHIDVATVESVLHEERLLLEGKMVELEKSRPSRLASRDEQNNYLAKSAEIRGSFDLLNHIGDLLIGDKPR